MTQINRTTLGKLNYRYDLAGNITTIGTQNYTYDTLDRLTSAPSRSYSYDANGNRTQDAGQNYILAPDSNRLMQGAGRAYDYDLAGNPLHDGRYQYHYDGQNRLSGVQQGATVVGRYTYNALGQRVRRETAAGITHYLYSSEGQLLAELDAQGNTQREYLYLQGWPVAVVSYSPPVAPLSADELPEAALETVEEYPETAESAPVDAKPVTSAPSTGSTDRLPTELRSARRRPRRFNCTTCTPTIWARPAWPPIAPSVSSGVGTPPRSAIPLRWKTPTATACASP